VKGNANGQIKATSAVISASHFPVEWPDDPDSEPPPGKQLAQALLDDMLRTSFFRAPKATLDDHSYEHSSWCFRIVARSASYWVDLEGDSDRRQKTTRWRVSIRKYRGVLKELFGSPDYDVPDECLLLLKESICRVFGIDQIEWLTERAAMAAFFDP
jgi:hypothetical protein